MTRKLAWIVGLGAIAALVPVSIAGVWLTNDLRAVGLVIMLTTPIAAGLVAYFDWRANLRRKALAEGQAEARRVMARSDSRLSL